MTVYHNHHIVPRHMDGSDDTSNIERITIEEHAERHKALYEQHGHEQDRIAWMALSGQITHAEATKLAQQMPKTDEWKKNASERNTGEGNPMFGKTFSHTDDAKRKIKEKLTGIKRTTEQNKANSERQLGRVFSEEHKRKLSEWERSPQHLEKLRQSNIGKPKSEHQKRIVADKLSKTWKITTPSGDQFLVTNLRAWAKENGLDQANLARGGNGTHKGYRATRQN